MNIERAKERIDRTGEVFTPHLLVHEMLDQLPSKIWSDPNKTWLEPSCGDGNILEAIFQRLMQGLEIWQPEKQKRHQHIIENMLFGVDLMPDNVEICIKRLGAIDLNHNIVCADSLVFDFNFGRPDIDESGIEIPVQKLFKKPGFNAWYVEILDLTQKDACIKQEAQLFDTGLFV
jgi:hypothetical protein